jgi:hypothetical protein
MSSDRKATRCNPILDPVVDRANIAADKAIRERAPGITQAAHLRYSHGSMRAAIEAAASAAVEQVCVAIASTRHFDFVVTGPTPEVAKALLMEAWRWHARDTGADPTWLSASDVDVLCGPLGQAWRDGSPIPPKAGA